MPGRIRALNHEAVPLLAAMPTTNPLFTDVAAGKSGVAGRFVRTGRYAKFCRGRLIIALIP